jgi:tRNA pseudouridine55 synthase
VTIHELRLAQTSRDTLAISVTCSAGTYVRSLARDMGVRLGCGGHLSSLRRTAVGAFSLGAALTLEELDREVRKGELESILISADEGIQELEAAIVTAEHGLQLRHGVVVDVPLRRPSGADVARIYDAAGEFVAIGAVAASGQIRPIKVLQIG